MKIYYASQSFYPHIGGVPTYLLNLAKEMANKGNEVVEVHLRPLGEENHGEIKGIEVHRVPKEPIDQNIMEKYSRFKEAVYQECHFNQKLFDKPAQDMEGFAEFNKVNEYFGQEIRTLLEQKPADIVHIHDFQLLFTYKYVPRGTPLIITWHIPFIKSMSRNLSEFLVKNLKEYDKIVFSSPEYIKAATKAGIPKEKLELIFPLANTNRFKPLEIDKASVKKAYNLPLDSKIILSVQRIDAKSGHEQLIKALHKVSKKVPNAILVFVGEKSMSNLLSQDRERLIERIKRMVDELGLNDKVFFLGNIDYNCLPELYNAADIVSLCSKNEGFGLSITEGMACGAPIVATRVGGIPLQVKNNKNGFLVEVGDVSSTASSIITLLSDSELKKKMSASALKEIEKKFKLEKGIEKHLIMYNDVRKIKNDLHNLEYLNLKNIKAVVTDLDRTITDKPARQAFYAADYDQGLLDELEGLNIDILLATGRSINYVEKLCRKFSLWRCVIAENGAVLYFPRNGKTITTNTVYMAEAKKIIQAMKLPGMTMGRVIISIDISHFPQVKRAIGGLSDFVKFIKNNNEIMILPIGVDKGVGLQLALRLLNIDVDKVIMIGDGENDIDMFLNPGYKIALANADEGLKKLANHVTKSSSTQGMREIIRKLKVSNR